MANNIQETQRKRFQFLKRLYEVTEGYELASVNLWELGDELRFTRPEIDRIDNFLRSEGLITKIALGGTIELNPCTKNKQVRLFEDRLRRVQE